MGGKRECLEPEELCIEDVVICISCGYYHTALVTGRSVGLRGRGAAGYGWEECPEPEEPRIEDVVTCISSGYYHTALVTGRSVGFSRRGAAGYG